MQFLDAIEPTDVMNLVQDGQRQHFPDAGYRPQAMKRVGVVALRLTHERQLEIVDEPVVLLKQRQVDFNGLADAGIGKVVRHAFPIGRICEPTLELWEVVLCPRVLNVGQQLPALAHEVQSAPQQIPR